MSIKCLLCGVEFDRINWTHLKSVHNVTTDEYYKMFPGAESMSVGLRHRLSEASKGNENAVGHVMYEETKRLLSAARTGNENALGCTHTVSEKTRKLMSESMMGNTSAEGHKVPERTRRQLAMAVSESMKKKWQDPEYQRRWAEGMNSKPNERELQLLSVLDKHFPNEWKYVGNGQVRLGNYNPDFINVNSKKQVIEVFGYHWHDPDYFPNRPTEEELIAYYKQFGSDCIVFWEYDVYNEEEVVRRIREKFMS